MATAAGLMRNVTLTKEAGITIDASQLWSVKGATDDNPQTALDTTGLPQSGEILNSGTPNVKVIRQSVVSISKQADGTFSFEIVIAYELFRPEEKESTYSLSGSTTLSQIETFEDRSGNPYTVTYNGVEKRFPIIVLQPRTTELIQFTAKAATPRVFVKAFVGKTNADQWRGEEPDSWLCFQGDWTLKDESSIPKEYDFTFVLNHKPEGWGYQAKFIDDLGGIPTDATEGNGLKTYLRHDAVNYGPTFGP